MEMEKWRRKLRRWREVQELFQRVGESRRRRKGRREQE
jgi:hypothetical protein